MKKISILAVALIAFSSTSCKKAYTCECISTDAYSTLTSSREISKTSKKNAQAICGDHTEIYTEKMYSGSSTTIYSEASIYNCALK